MVLFCFLAPGLLALPEASASLPYLWPWTGLYQAVITLALISATGWCFFPRRVDSAPCPGFATGITTILAAGAVATLASRFPERAAFGLLVPVGGVATAIVTCRFINHAEDYKKSTLDLMRLVGAIAILIYFRSGTLWLTDSYFQQAHAVDSLNAILGLTVLQTDSSLLANTHPFGHANYTAGAVVLTLPVCAGLAIIEASRWRIFWAAGSLAGAAVLLLTGSRAGAGALLAMIPVACILGLSYRRVSRGWFYTGLAALSLLAAGCALLHPEIRATVLNLFQGFALGTSDSARLRLAETGLQMGFAKPLTGHGLSTTSLLYPAFWNGSGSISNAFQLHSTPFQIFADLGIIGLLGVGILLASVFLTWKRLRASAAGARDRALFTAVNALGLGIFGYGLFSLTDFQCDVYYISGTLGVLGGLMAGIGSRVKSMVGNANEPRATGTPRWRYLWCAQFGMLVFAGFFCWQQLKAWNARYYYHQALSAIRNGDLEGFSKLSDAAIRWAPRDPLYRNQLGWHLALGSHRAETTAESQRLIAGAAAAWEASLEIAETQEFCHFNLGWLYLATDPEVAIRHFRRAAAIQPGKRGVYFGLALALRKLGSDQAAFRALALELFSQPAFSTWALWDDPKFSFATEEVTGYLQAYYEKAETGFNGSPRALNQLKSVSRLSAWWGGFEKTATGAVPFPWANTTGAGSRRGLDILKENPSLATSPVFCYLAWSEKTAALNYLRAAQMQSKKIHLDETELRQLAHFFTDTPGSYRDLLRKSRLSGPLPFSILRNSRPAFGLLARNVELPTPGDLFIYEQPVLLQLALEPLIPSEEYLPGPLLNKLLEELLP